MKLLLLLLLIITACQKKNDSIKITGHLNSIEKLQTFSTDINIEIKNTFGKPIAFFYNNWYNKPIFNKDSTLLVIENRINKEVLTQDDLVSNLTYYNIGKFGSSGSIPGYEHFIIDKGKKMSISYRTKYDWNLLKTLNTKKIERSLFIFFYENNIPDILNSIISYYSLNGSIDKKIDYLTFKDSFTIDANEILSGN